MKDQHQHFDFKIQVLIISEKQHQQSAIFPSNEPTTTKVNSSDKQYHQIIVKYS
jgi:hypothetical protein